MQGSETQVQNSLLRLGTDIPYKNVLGMDVLEYMFSLKQPQTLQTQALWHLRQKVLCMLKLKSHCPTGARLLSKAAGIAVVKATHYRPETPQL